MLVNRLALIVVFRMSLPIWAGDCLRRFVSFEAQISRLVLLRLFLIPKSAIAKHQVVLRLQVFRINRQHAVQRFYSLFVFSLQEQYATEIIDGDAVSRVLCQDFVQLRGSAIIVSFTAEDASIEIVRS